MKRLITLFLIFFTISQLSLAQVGKAKQNAKEHKKEKSSGDLSTSSDGDDDNLGDDIIGGCFLFIGDLIFSGIGQIQAGMLDRRFDEPWIVSADAQLTAAIDPRHGSVSFAPTVRGTWGLFSMQVRTNRLFDATGTLQTLDWQILQINILSQEYVSLRYGVGFTHEFTESQNHFEQYAGLQLHFDDRKINPEFNIRWLDDAVPRLEMNAFIDWKFSTAKPIDVGLIAGYSYQRWYREPFHMIMTGLSFRIE